MNLTTETTKRYPQNSVKISLILYYREYDFLEENQNI